MKAEKDGIASSSWFLKGNIAKVVKCHTILGGALTKRMERNLNNNSNKQRIKVVEEGGASVTASLRSVEPFKETGCRLNDEACIEDGRQYYAQLGCI